MTAEIVAITSDNQAAHWRKTSYRRMYQPGTPSASERSQAAQHLAYKVAFGEPLTGDDRLILAVRIAHPSVEDPALIFDSLAWELAGPGFGPRLARILDTLIGGDGS